MADVQVYAFEVASPDRGDGFCYLFYLLSLVCRPARAVSLGPVSRDVPERISLRFFKFPFAMVAAVRARRRAKREHDSRVTNRLNLLKNARMFRRSALLLSSFF